jgi:tRNA-dihydrouridine synthase C
VDYNLLNSDFSAAPISSNKKVKLFLAPMEGVTDWVLRDLTTSLGGIDHCVTEFLRVTDKLHPEIIFHRNCPELKTGSRTRAGTPVFIQLLGGHAEPLAMNAARAASLGALGIDLNFGCPAKTVNRHEGGAVLLKNCSRIYDIVKSVRSAVPEHIPVTAKIRLGFDNPEVCLENAKAIEEAGATWLTVHCRTKTDGYKPPAYWDWMPRLREVVKLPLIANGEIWNVADFVRCQEVTGCDQFMIGRGIMSNPYIFKQIKNYLSLNSESGVSPNELQSNWERNRILIPQFFEASTIFVNNYFAVSRTKQWLKALSIKDPVAKSIFDELKIITNPLDFQSALEKHCQ